MIRRNVGGLDRRIRLGLGALLAFAGVTFHSTLMLIAGAMLLASGAVGFCALYIPFGICTARRTKSEPEPPA
jgi:hypothetical protein